MHKIPSLSHLPLSLSSSQPATVVVPRNAAEIYTAKLALVALNFPFICISRIPPPSFLGSPLSLSLCWNSANKPPRIGGQPRPRPRISLAALFPEFPHCVPFGMGRARNEPRHLDAYLSSLKNHPHQGGGGEGEGYHLSSDDFCVHPAARARTPI